MRDRLLTQLALLGASSFLTVMSGVANAQQAAQTPQAPANAKSGATDTVTVRGYQLQNAQAVAAKKAEVGIADFLTSDEIGQQPDYNISDSFRRVPGVQTIFDEDEGRYVAVRGLNPDYTLATFNGITVASSERGNRRINLEQVPSGAVRRLKVLKSRTAEVEGNAIGGVIDMVTASAFDHKGFSFVADGFIGMASSTGVPGENFRRKSDDGPDIRGDLTVSDTFGPNDEFGVLFTASVNRKRRDQERYNPPGYTDPLATAGVAIPTRFNYSSYPNSVDRYGAMLKLDYRPSDTFEASGSLTYFTQDDNELRYIHAFTPTTGGTNLTQTAPSTLRGASVTTAGSYVLFNDFPIQKPLMIGEVNAEWRPTQADVIAVRAGRSWAEWLEKSQETRFNLRSNVNTGFTYSPGGDRGAVLTFDNPSVLTDPNNYVFNYFQPYRDDSDEYVSEVKVDWTHNIGAGERGLGFGAGALLRETIRDFDTYRNAYTPSATPLPLTNFQLSESYQGPFDPVQFPILDYRKFKDYFLANPSQFPLDARTTLVNSLQSDYRVTEGVDAVYGRLRFTGEKWLVEGGLRYESTDTKVRRLASLTQAATAPAPGNAVLEVLPVPSATTRQFFVTANRNGKDNATLPSLLFSYQFSDSLRLRASYSKAIGRPNQTDLAANETVSATNTITRGNPDLRPRQSDNFDLQLDWYFADDDGVLSAGVFDKEIKDDIFRATSTEVINGVTYTVTQPVNVATARVSGLEFNVIRNNLPFLPQGFGVSANATLLDAEETILMGSGVTRKLDQLLQQPKVYANLSVFYERGPFEARMAVSSIGDYYQSIATDAQRNDQVEHTLTQIDLTGRYRLTDNLQLHAEVRNLTDEHREIFTGADEDLARDLNYYGRHIWVGLTYKY